MRSFDYSLLEGKVWDSDILNLISKISEHKGRQELYLKQEPDVLENLVELSIIQSTQSSNEIEGIRTTDSRVKDLIFKNTAPRNRDEEEILGYQEVLSLLHESYLYIPIKGDVILQLHRELFKYSPSSVGGRYKNTQNYILETSPSGEKSIRFTPLPPHQVKGAIDTICESYNREIDKGVVHPLILIPVFIHDFLCIHPFSDGNGRMSRLLTTLLLYKQGYVVGKYISLEEKIEKTKESYNETLDRSGVLWHKGEEDVTPFVKYILQIILSAYRDFEERVDIFGGRLSALQQVERAVDKILGKFTKKDIMKLTPAISRASVEKALKELVDKNVIERHGKGRATYYVKKY